LDDINVVDIKVNVVNEDVHDGGEDESV